MMSGLQKAIVISYAIIFIVAKTLLWDYSGLILNVFGSLILLSSFLKFRSIFIPIALFSILSFSGFFSIFMVGILFIIYIINISQRSYIVSREEFIILLFLFLITIQTLLIGGNYSQAFLKTISLFSLPSFYFLFIKHREKFNFEGISIVYITLTITQIIYAFFIDLESRSSIFNFSENIMLIIVTMTYMLTLAYKKNIYLSAINFSLLLIFIFSTESRTSFLMILIIIPFLVIRALKNSSKPTIIYITLIPIIIITFVFFIPKMKDSALFMRSEKIVELMSSFNSSSANEFYDKDLRGQIYDEGLSLWNEKPIQGNGAVPTKVLSAIEGQPIYNFHSSLIDTLVQYGIIGLSLITGMIFLLIRSTRKITKSKLVSFHVFIFIVASLPQPTLFNFKAISIFYFTLFIMVAKEAQKDRYKEADTINV